MATIRSIDPLAERYVAYTIDAPEIARSAAPGQLVMAQLPDERHVGPHSIADLNPEDGTLTIVVRSLEGTSNPPVPDTPIDLEGPLGQAARVEPISKALFIAQGLGVAAMLPRLRQYKENDCYTAVIAGHPSKDFVYWSDRLDRYSDELYTATEDGSFGIKGTLRQMVRAVCQTAADIERAVMIGSLSGMKAACSVTTSLGIPTTISLGAVMEAHQTRDDDTDAAGATTFDWSQATDLDARNVDFDGLVELLGAVTAK